MHHHSTENGSFTINDYIVDVGDNTVSDGVASQHVEPKAMSVLYELALNAGQTVSRQALLSSVWGDRVVVEEALTRTISQLRAIFNDSKDKQLIQTIPKKGYRLKARITWLQDDQRGSDTTPPSGDDPSAAIPSARPGNSDAGAHKRPMLIAFLALILAALLWWWYSSKTTEQSSSAQLQTPSIALLPLKNLSGDEQTLYLAEGLPDELLSHLAKLDALEIPSRYSTFALARKGLTTQELAEQLQVQFVLEGSVRKTNSAYNISVRLVDAASDRTVWAQTYQKALSDIFEVQSDIADNLVQAMLPEQNQQPVSDGNGSMPDVEAYQHYLKGIYWWMNGKTSEWFYRAESALSEATQRDPEFAAAHGALAYIYARYDYHDLYMDKATATQKSRQAIERALAIQPDETNALLARAILATSGAEFDTAQRALDKVLSANANHTTALYLNAELALARNQPDMALTFSEQALRADPLSPWVNVNLAIVHFWRGELEQALAYTHKATDIDSQYTWAYVWRAKILEQQGKLADAITAMQQCLAIDQGSPTNTAYLGLLYLQLGMTQQAQQYFAQTATLYGDSNDARLWRSFTRFVMPQRDDDIAIQLLEQSELLDNRMFSLLPLLYQKYVFTEQRSRGVTFFKQRLQPNSRTIANYRNQHAINGLVNLLEDSRGQGADWRTVLTHLNNTLPETLQVTDTYRFIKAHTDNRATPVYSELAQPYTQNQWWPWVWIYPEAHSPELEAMRQQQRLKLTGTSSPTK
ncbi:winged helix-turn-helix domain-containing protein [Aestuariibacter halophilus]|uniref:Winged helix-turn-helix domain-containing protein n=1 Tax=Fluctibacter halophilus TaxID=226011 RepID=A0ABS8G9S4_9ALTE|nr:winged helix-turn-helix domain-containing protein [Aestuariibacter halophilus]MCC2617285.1 winged helix-turn-helix domain-containing protein [Aestuariibacter halophilus]